MSALSIICVRCTSLQVSYPADSQQAGDALRIVSAGGTQAVRSIPSTHCCWPMCSPKHPAATTPAGEHSIFHAFVRRPWLLKDASSPRAQDSISDRTQKPFCWPQVPYGPSEHDREKGLAPSPAEDKAEAQRSPLPLGRPGARPMPTQAQTYASAVQGR